MKTKFSLRIFLACAFFLGVLAMNAQTKVYVYKTDGTDVEFNIDEVDSISFTSPVSTLQSLPFMERFDGADFPPQGWTMIDKDGDGYNWYAYDNRFICAISDTEDDDGNQLFPNNFLISPKITISGTNPTLEWNIGSAASPSYVFEHYKVVVSTTKFTAANCETNGDVVKEETLSAEASKILVNRSVDLSAYAGKDVYIAWVHDTPDDMYALFLGDIRIGSTENPAPVTAPVMGTMPAIGNASSPGLYTVESIISNDGGVSVVKRGFCYATTHNPTIESAVVEVAAYADDVFSSFSADLSLAFGKTYYVRAFAQNAVGVSYSNEQTVVVPDESGAVFLDESFATDPLPDGEWTVIDKDGDGYTWEWYDGAMTSDSWRSGGVGALTPENYLISPAFTIDASASTVTLAFQVAAEDDTDYKEQYKVIVSENAITADNCRSADVLQDWTELTEASSDETFTGVSIDMTAYKGKTVYIGIVHGNCTDQYYILVRNLKVFAN